MSDAPPETLSDAPAAPAQPSAPEPGYRSSEAWLTFLAMALGAVPSSGLVAGAPLAAQLVGMAIAALAVLGYTTSRTSLKRAHLAAAAGQPATPAPLVTKTAAASAIATLAIVAAIGCSSLGTATKTGAGAFLTCGTQDLTQVVGDKTLLATVADDLVGGNYLAAIDALVARLGNDAVGCAVLAVETVTAAGKTSGAAALSPLELRARELIDKYGWKIAPIPATAARGSGS